MSLNIQEKDPVTGELKRVVVAGTGKFPADFGTKAEFEEKKDSLPVGTVFTTTDEFEDLYKPTKVDVVLYDEFDIKVDNIQNRLYLLGDILFGSLYLRFDEEHNPMVVQLDSGWIDIGDVPQIANAPQLYTCISYADTEVGDDYAQGDVRIYEGKLSIRIKKQPTVSRNNWYVFYNAVCMKVELAN